jgi:hypothetical protein
MDGVFKGTIILFLFFLGLLFQITNMASLEVPYLVIFICTLVLILEWLFGMLTKLKEKITLARISWFTAFFILPVIYCILFAFFLDQFHPNTPNDLYAALNGIYPIYITITTIFLSVCFVIISVPSTLSTEKSRPDIVSTINYTVIAYAVGGIGISMFSLVISNFQGYGIVDISSIKANLFLGFITSSFVVVGTIFGTILLVLAIMVSKYGNPVRELWQRLTSQ